MRSRCEEFTAASGGHNRRTSNNSQPKKSSPVHEYAVKVRVFLGKLVFVGPSRNNFDLASANRADTTLGGAEDHGTSMKSSVEGSHERKMTFTTARSNSSSIQAGEN